ncbi:TetR/AcrR family transcriptional regulator [Trujillonella endophytica]|uniref:Transcriptional regulator, TetR family n=1 Tax=Trujillonella endophytica TaxID=673521 RepID=A0A1H8SUK5_9ACTN|nr:TetR family transcriptional regulator [Trujillella endophytica]SEO82372.1 transcriptional regulator, TetR family [Trujillella endophytica]
MQTDGAATLADAKRRAAEQHVLDAVRRHVVRHGLDATMEELAAASGLSRRTLFRMFASRERLIGAAFEAGFADLAQELPAYDGDLERWVAALCRTAHQLNASHGPGYWEFTSRADLPAELAASQHQRRLLQRATARDLADTMWRAAGRDGAPADTLVACVGAHLSAHFTAAVTTDLGSTWEAAAEIAARAVLAELDRHAPA